MRQAGRYLPEYRALRQKHTLWEMFHDPEIAAAVTRMPLETIGFDAAILFSDILVIAEAFGLTVHFPEKGGPYIEPAVTTADSLQLRNVEESLHYVSRTISLLKPDLRVPLIGFCGGPFTVASYLIDRGGKEGKTLSWLQNDPESFHRLLDKITTASIAYLRMQIQAGVDAIQVFDSWASLLNPAQFETFSLPYLQKIVQAIKIPVILFCRNSSLYPQQLSSLNPAGISFDWHKPMHELRTIVPANIAIQGNFDPEFLKSSPERIQAETRKLLHSMEGDPGFIVNLGHGVLPDTPVDNVRCFVDTVKNY